jgi:hypothetical protein
MLFGIIAFVAGSILLFWNEGNYIKTYKTIEEAKSITIHVDNVAAIDEKLNGKLVHASAMTETKDILRDNDFGVEINAVKLLRKTKYYQWNESSRTETRDKVGGGQTKTTTYSYNKNWSNSPVNSTDFHDPEYRNKNTFLVKIDPSEQIAPTVTFGAYVLPDFLKRKITGEKSVDINLTTDIIKKWEKIIIQSNPQLQQFITPTQPPPQITPPNTAQPNPKTSDEFDPNKKDTTPEIEKKINTENSTNNQPVTQNEKTTTDEKPSSPLIHFSDNDQSTTIYFGKNPYSPEIGDVQVIFSKVLPAEVSIIARVSGSTFETFRSASGRDFSAFAMGNISAEKMFVTAHDSNLLLTWIIRFGGAILVIVGLCAVFDIIKSLAMVLPFLGNFIGAGIGVVCFILGLCWSLFLIAVAWLFFRPFVGGLLLAVVIAGFILLKITTGQNAKTEIISDQTQQKNKT